MNRDKICEPFRGEVPCYWCGLEDGNAGLPPERCGGIKATCRAKEPFEGKYACDDHANLLMIAGWFDGQMELRPDTPETHGTHS